MIKATTKSGQSVTVYVKNEEEFNREYARLVREGARITSSRLP